DPEILKFIARIGVEHELKFEGDNGRYRVACRLVVRLRNGTEHETTVPLSQGKPGRPDAGRATHGEVPDLDEAN
ncbi:MAG TPA: hypothetical protein VK148_19825, partial [Xanthobacteraceae bacterium]|nr:hypothetical protein [Xanthobacteraceae bacterium]